KDAKSLLQAVKKRFGGNAATKKTQRNLLKKPYKNFTTSSSEKFLRSLSPEWNTHTIVWRNKPDIDTLSLDDLYNNLKIYELEVKGTSSSNTNTQNVAFVSSNSTSSTNGAVNTDHGAWNGYLRKGRKTKPKRQNQTRNRKARKRQSQSPSPSLKKSTESQPKSTPKPKVKEI
ncbi:hypothetical protein Tco_1261758, partial [Tanacetum coccineum]